jgi:hypothetical protein
MTVGGIQQKNGGCIAEAHALRKGNGDGGDVYFVKLMGNVPVYHAYYVPDKTRKDDFALNQADNGYPQYPRLHVKEVLAHGTIRRM